MRVNCPKCDADISDTYEPDDWSVGIVGGWFCDACDLAIGEGEVDRGHDDDVAISPAPRKADGEIGTPISKLSGQPGQPGYAELLAAAIRAKDLLKPEVTKEPDRTIFWELVDAIAKATGQGGAV